MEVTVYFQGLLFFPFFNKDEENQYENVQNLINFQTEASSCISFYLIPLPLFIPFGLSLPIKRKLKLHTYQDYRFST